MSDEEGKHQLRANVLLGQDIPLPKILVPKHWQQRVVLPDDATILFSSSLDAPDTFCASFSNEFHFLSSYELSNTFFFTISDDSRGV